MKKEGMKIFWLFALLLLFLVVPSTQAQTYRSDSLQPDVSRFRWEGVVDGTVIIRLKRRQIDIERISGQPVQRQRYDFSDPLPNTRVDVELEVREGRGRVRLIQQPRPENDYVAAVRIEDDQGGASFYSFELRWPYRNWRDRDDDERWRNRRELDSFTWRGRVDRETIIRIRGDEVKVDNISGYGVNDVRYRFSAPLPAQPVQVSLVETEGRGEIVLLDQPNYNNNFTASVRIRDEQGGASSYAFTHTWQPRRRERPRDGDWSGGPNQAGLTWAGRVDGRDVLHIRYNELWVEHQAGAPITGAEYRFFRPLPYERRTVTVRKIRGRGTVRVLEQPSAQNNFVATILLEDRDGGADRYEIEISW